MNPTLVIVPAKCPNCGVEIVGKMTPEAACWDGLRYCLMCLDKSRCGCYLAVVKLDPVAV